MSIKYKVITIESEAGWGQKYEEHFFDTVESAIKYRDKINSYNDKDYVPDWYMIAEDEILVVEVQ